MRSCGPPGPKGTEQKQITLRTSPQPRAQGLPPKTYLHGRWGCSVTPAARIPGGRGGEGRGGEERRGQERTGEDRTREGETKERDYILWPETITQCDRENKHSGGKSGSEKAAKATLRDFNEATKTKTVLRLTTPPSQPRAVSRANGPTWPRPPALGSPTPCLPPRRSLVGLAHSSRSTHLLTGALLPARPTLPSTCRLLLTRPWRPGSLRLCSKLRGEPFKHGERFFYALWILLTHHLLHSVDMIQFYTRLPLTLWIPRG